MFPNSEVEMDLETRKLLTDKAKRMAQCDMIVNGEYANAPYRVVFDGVRYVARVRSVTNAKGEICGTRIEIEQPVQHIGSEML
jgi:hypothetical protein